MTPEEAVAELKASGLITHLSLVKLAIDSVAYKATADETLRCAKLADCWGTSSTEADTAAHRRCRNLAKAIRSGGLEVDE